ncbi:MAG: AAA family ATPase [Ignavibacterium sp.]|nr:AAA family ATPase [Ignavibacterium sp.]MDW8375340.1 ATP-binding protein [Ignavibacteriales bacterium]
MKLLKAPKHRELKPSELRWKCNPEILEFDSTEQIEPIEGILGQDRALKAIRLGVDIKSPGYNIFIAGLSGSGKATTIKKMLEHFSQKSPELFDYAYVNNFKDPDKPILLKFPKGKAKEFKQDIKSAIELLKQKVPLALESEIYLERKKNLINEFNLKEQELMEEFDKELRYRGFALGQIKIGETIRPDILPIIDNQPVPISQLDDLLNENKITKEQAKKIFSDYQNNLQDLQLLYKKATKLSQDFQERIKTLERENIEIIVRGVFELLKEKYNDSSIHNYLIQVEEDILENIYIFKTVKSEEVPQSAEGEIDYFYDYQVNIILDNSDTQGCPVIIETNPTYVNLFGTIEKVTDGQGGFYTDFTKIKAGSLLRANGGYLVLNVIHLFEEPGVWRTLKRILTYNKLEIQESQFSFISSSVSLKPQPIDIDTKVILIGNYLFYAYLSEREYDFKKMFKVLADFDYEISIDENVIRDYVRVIKKLIKEENLLEFDKNAIAYILELAAMFAGRQDKLTLRFSKIADILREANYWALEDGMKTVSTKYVEKAYRSIKERHSMLETKITEMYKDGYMLIDTTGERVGQINGLAVYDANFYTFGRPIRITATVSLGSGTIINVEREAGMSGKHYNKGVLIISGYFRETFGQDLPLSFNANLVFEQSYGMVEGDSASCTEIFALLSVLSGLPIKQSIAVTGSLNQKGDVQPIGGVNEKIEGFFDICQIKGLDGKQGVIFPVQNIRDLMLKEEVIEAVRKNKFHLYPISRVEEGIEILTGVKAGKKLKDGFEEGTVFYLVQEKIKELYAKSRQIKQSQKGDNSKKKK